MYGQMNEPPGARARVALTGLLLNTSVIRRDRMYFSLLTTSLGSSRPDQRYAKPNRFFIICPCYEQNKIIYTCVVVLQVSALLGRIPSGVGYQPTLATDMGTMQERITTTKKGSITAVQVRLYKMLLTSERSPFFWGIHTKIADFITGYLCVC